MNEPDVINAMLGNGTGRTIAVLGLAETPARPSHYVAEYLQQHGYKIYPVNPALRSVFGEKSYPSLAALPVKPDVVNVFRVPSQIPAIVDDMLALGLRITLLSSGSLLAKTADRQLARALGGRNYTLLMEQRRGALLQPPAAIKCTMRPLCRSEPEPASRCSPVAQRDELRLRAPERVGPVCHRGLPVVRRAGRGKAETPAAGGHSWNEQTRTRPRG